jgi:hypothetical protein
MEPLPSPGPTNAATRWRIVAPPLAVPAAYLDFGFAGDGDLLVVATDDITDAKLGLWVARYRPDGTRVSKKAIDGRITRFAGDWIDIDPTDDTVVITERGAGTTYTGRRISSTTGKTIASINFNDAVERIAIDRAGRMFAVSPAYPSVNSKRPCIVGRLGRGGGVAEGVDWFSDPCGVRGYTAPPTPFGDPTTIEIGRDGRLWIIDKAAGGVRRHDEPAGIALTVLGGNFDFVRHWHISLEWAWNSGPFLTSVGALTLAGSADGTLYLGETLMSADATHSTGFRIRVFDKSGALLRTFGDGGDQAGVTWPTAPNVDGNDRLWVIDLDIATRAYSIKVVE